MRTFVTESTSSAVRHPLDSLTSFERARGSGNLVEVREILAPEIAALAATRAEPFRTVALCQAGHSRPPQVTSYFETENVMTQIGFVGLGVMGSRMVKRLLDAGRTVTGYNRTRSKAQWLLDAGMRWAETPRKVAESAEVIFSMITDTKALRAITQGDDGILAGLSAGKVYVDMSTVSPAASREIAEQVAATGAQMLDAPVSGSVITLEQGALSIMVGGTRSAFEQVKAILHQIGPKVTYVGGNGLGVTLKIATNLSLAVQMLAFSEGVLLAEKSGIARETSVAVLLNSVIASPMVKYRGPFVLNMPGEAWFDVNMMQKDMTLALELGRQLDVPLPTTAATNEMLTAARGMGLAQEDFAILFEALARMSGLSK